jgi:hypothetical protein
MGEHVDLDGSPADDIDQGILAATLLLAAGVKMALTAPGRFILRLPVNDEMLGATSVVVSPPNAQEQASPAIGNPSPT